MTKAIIVAFHKYTPYGDKYYEPIFNHFMYRMDKYRNEFDKLYLLDSNWGINNCPGYAEVIKVSPHLRYYDAYKEVLPKIKEDTVLLMDNDMVMYQKGIIDATFCSLIESESYPYSVVSIYDTIGTYKTDKMNGKNKLCPYWFAACKELLMKFRNVEWGPNMPEHETLGKITEVMLNDGVQPIEMEEDKSNCLLRGDFHGSVVEFDGGVDKMKSKDLGYYHIRAGSTPALLLAWRQHDNKQFFKYITEQPKTEYLRQFAWYWIMGGSIYMDQPLFKDLGVDYSQWLVYVESFRKYHGL